MQGAAPRQSMLMFVIQVGGGFCLPILIFGALLTLWGLINLAFVKNRGLLIAQALLSYVPLGLAFLGLVGTFSRFMAHMGAAPPPQPAVIADNAALGFLCGLTGAMSTAVPGVIGVFALARNLRRPATTFGVPFPPTVSTR